MSEDTLLFISPHLDDVALSCGGYIRKLTASGKRVIVLTVVTADPPENLPFTWLIQRCHRNWNAGDKPFEPRCREDIAAMQSFGAENIHLGLLDAIYRQTMDGAPRYTKDTVNVPVHEEDWNDFEPLVRQKLAEAIHSFNLHPAQIYCPLGVGQHVDHIIIRRAVEGLCDPSLLRYYEEYPYAIRPKELEKWLRTEGRSDKWSPTVVKLTANEIEARISAISCYSSQITFLFPSILQSCLEIAHTRLPITGKYFPIKHSKEDTCRRMAAKLKTYVSSVGGERYWTRSTVLSEKYSD